MNTPLHSLRSHWTPLSWLLTVALLCLLLFPHHYHLHDQPLAGDAHHHVVDVHHGLDLVDSDHPEADHSLTPAKDFTQSAKLQLPVLALLVTLFLLLPLPAAAQCFRPDRVWQRPTNASRYRSPLLRAPPRA